MPIKNILCITENSERLLRMSRRVGERNEHLPASIQVDPYPGSEYINPNIGSE